MSGTKIETFDFEIISIMSNAWYARQDIILVRCSGLNLEHSGIIAGMSGSPCYITDETGRERMIGAVAFGWSTNKDPICGLQPITQMLEIPEYYTTKDKSPVTAAKDSTESNLSAGIPVGRIVADLSSTPIPQASRFSILNDSNDTGRPLIPPASAAPAGLWPLKLPVAISTLSEPAMSFLQPHFDRLGFTPVTGGGAGPSVRARAEDVQLEPGSVFCIPFMSGDLEMAGLGTCTEVIGERVLAFGHAAMGDGEVELPIATGAVHTIIPSIVRSVKIGAALRNVGTLRRDENAGVFGVQGPAPAMIPMEISLRDVRGERVYRYEIVQERFLTAVLAGMGLLESIYAHHSPPEEHNIRYAIEAEFEQYGVFRTSNMTSQDGGMGAQMDLYLPIQAMMNAPFGKARLKRCRVVLTIEKGALQATIDDAQLRKTTYKPGETVTVRVRFRHYRRDPQLTWADFSLDLPDNVPDGRYELMVTSVNGHLQALTEEKPHLFLARSPDQLLAALNMVAGYPANRLYLRLRLPEGGLAIDKIEMPAPPTFWKRILTESRNRDVRSYAESSLAQYETDFSVDGNQTLTIIVDRRADQ
ncbi:MAG: hypothetical protein GXY44_14660 [Phycisphaerales bacterium]|nr:hypothetical protein [Phycisphaerales bacterium]